MKSIKVLIPVLFALITLPAFAQEKTETIKVFGNCGMCKNRIDKSLKTEGINKADWDVETKQLTVTYNTAAVSLADIHKRIAAVGHDTEQLKADDAVYAKLPGCCKYERQKKEAKQLGQ